MGIFDNLFNNNLRSAQKVLLENLDEENIIIILFLF